MKKNNAIIIWLLAGCFLVYMMVIIGGLTRLTHSGLSMVEWKPTGSLPPMNTEEWNIQFDKYKQSPEFKLINYDFTLSDFKSIFWWEYIHRFLGRIIGVVFILPFFYFLIRKQFPVGFIRKMLLLLFIGALQGFVGWFMVSSGLQQNPNVSHYRLATHLITALTAFAFTFWFALDLLYPNRESVSNPKLKKYATVIFVLVVFQIIYGAFVAGLKAGYVYPTFPKMGSQWVPDGLLELQPWWRNYTETQVGVQFVHRCLAYLVVTFIGLLWWNSKKSKLSPIQVTLLNWFAIIVLMQFTLGVITILFGVPVIIAIIHQTGAFFLFSTALFLIHRLR